MFRSSSIWIKSTLKQSSHNVAIKVSQFITVVLTGYSFLRVCLGASPLVASVTQFYVLGRAFASFI
jgi:hypothetical protein